MVLKMRSDLSREMRALFELFFYFPSFTWFPTISFNPPEFKTLLPHNHIITHIKSGVVGTNFQISSGELSWPEWSLSERSDRCAAYPTRRVEQCCCNSGPLAKLLSRESFCCARLSDFFFQEKRKGIHVRGIRTREDGFSQCVELRACIHYEKVLISLPMGRKNSPTWNGTHV